MESICLDTNVTALSICETEKLMKYGNIDINIHTSLLKDNPFILLVGIGSQLEIYLPSSNVSITVSSIVELYSRIQLLIYNFNTFVFKCYRTINHTTEARYLHLPQQFMASKGMISATSIVQMFCTNHRQCVLNFWHSGAKKSVYLI